MKKTNIKDNRLKSLIFLIFWIVFAIGVMTLYRPLYNESVKTYQDKQTDSVNSIFMDNYSYSLLDTKDGKISIITGKAYDDYNLFSINGKEYYYNGSVYLMDEDVTKVSFELGYLKITPKMINDFIDRAVSLGDNSYSVSLTDFMVIYDANSLNDVSSDNLSEKEVLIKVYKKDKLFYKVDIDITEFVKLKENVSSDILTINYTDVNEVDDFTKEYESRVQK